MPQPKSVHDLCITIPPPDAARLAQARQDHAHLEGFAAWSRRSDSQFLMRLGENLFHLAFPTPDAVGDFAAELVSAVQADAVLRLWIHADDPRLALLPWEYLCLTQDAVDECRGQGLDLPT